MSRFWLALIVSGAVALAGSATVGGQLPTAGDDPFAFFGPVFTLKPSERELVDRGEVLVRVLPAGDKEVAVFAVARLEAEPDALVRWTNAIDQLKRGRFVQAIKRFSQPPALSDLDTLVLDDVDLEGLRRCRVGDCNLKLAAHEIQSLQEAARAGQEWKPGVQREFRRVLFDRVSKYLAHGVSGLPPYVDTGQATLPRDELTGFLDRSPHLRHHLPAIARGLADYPRAPVPVADSFLYWSKEYYGRGKPIVAVTHVHIARPVGASLPPVVVLGQEVFASHYRDGSLGTTFVVDGGETRYLVYVNRSTLDGLGGVFVALKRTLVERKLASELKTVIETIRDRIEAGNPS